MVSLHLYELEAVTICLHTKRVAAVRGCARPVDRSKTRQIRRPPTYSRHKAEFLAVILKSQSDLHARSTMGDDVPEASDRKRQAQDPRIL